MNKTFLLFSFIFVSLSTQAQYVTWQPKTYYADVHTGTTVTGTQRDGTGSGYAGPRMAYETFSPGDTLYATINDIQKFNIIGLSSVAVLSTDALASNTNVKYALFHGYDNPEFISWVENGIEGTHSAIGSLLYLRIIYGTSIVYQTSSNGILWATYRTAPTAPSGAYYIFVQLENPSVASAFLNVRKGVKTFGGPVNKRPVATAPADQSLAYGVTTTSVTGIASDTDGTITARLWSMISGPNFPTFVTPAAATTAINGLISGTYKLSFKVTDDSSASAEDTMLIIVASPPSGGSGGSSGTTSFTPVIIHATDTDIIRPGASLEYWIYQSLIPYPTAASPSDNGMDRYDRFEWRSFENGAPGTYTWTEFDNSIAAAISKNQKFSFGIMTLCTSCSDFATQEGGSTLNSYPVYLHTLMQAEDANNKDWTNAGNWIPNYNSPNYLNRHKALLEALAAHIATSSYNGVPYSRVIRYIDVRGIGDYSEWHHNGYLANIPTGRFPTVATYKRVIDDYLAAFPNFQLVSLSDGFDPAGDSKTPPEVISYILNAKNNVGKLGYRRDNIGSGYLWVNTKLENNPAVWNGVNLKDSIMTRWKTAPLVGEPMGCCSADGGGSLYFDLERQVSFYHINSLGNGNIESPGSAVTINAFRAAGRIMGHRYTITGGSAVDTIITGSSFNISLNLRNDGNSPTYERWHITYELRNDTTNAVVWSAISPYNLKSLLPSLTDTAVTNGYTVPNSVAPGTYRLHLIIRDSSGYRQPYPLAINGRQTDGSYILVKSITVLNGVTANVPPTSLAAADQSKTLLNASASVAGTSTIIEDEREPAVRIGEASATENSQLAQVKVYLTAVSRKSVKVKYETKDKSARYPEDYSAASGQITFQPGETVKYFNVVIKQDNLNENTEEFGVRLKDAENATLENRWGGGKEADIKIINSSSNNSGSNNMGMLMTDQHQNLQLKVMPNPTTNYFQLNINSNGKGVIRLCVTDMLGRVMEDRKIEGLIQQIKLGENWRNGTYILEITQGKERKTSQLVKLR